MAGACLLEGEMISATISGHPLSLFADEVVVLEYLVLLRNCIEISE
jgi:hypothetical protein